MLNIGFSEFRRLFRTPLAWVLLALVQLILAYFFWYKSKATSVRFNPRLLPVKHHTV